MSALYASVANRGTQYDVAIFETPHGPALALVNFGRCMRVPAYWRNGLHVDYLAEKLHINEVDAEGVLMAIETIAEDAHV